MLMRFILLLFLCRQVLLIPRQHFFIIPPDEVEGEDGLLRLEELTGRNLHRYIGKLEDSSDLDTEFLARYSLIENTRRCYNCDQKMSLVKDKKENKDTKLWRCSGCKKEHISTKTSLRSQSFFEGFHLTPKQVIYLAADWIEHPTKPILQVAREFKVDKNSIIKVHELFRQLTQSWFYRETGKDQHEMLGGPNKVVEIDETLMYRAKYNRGRMLTRRQVWVFGMIERGTSKIIMFRVNKRNAQTLIPILRKYVRPGTTIMSDAWRAYGGIEQLQEGYNHGVVTHKTNFVAPNDRRVHTQSIEASWGVLKRQLKARFGDPEHRLGGHLFNYMFRRFFENKKLLNHLIYEMKFFKKPETPQMTDDGFDIDWDTSSENSSESSEEISDISGISSDDNSDDKIEYNEVDEMAEEVDEMAEEVDEMAEEVLPPSVPGLVPYAGHRPSQSRRRPNTVPSRSRSINNRRRNQVASTSSSSVGSRRNQQPFRSPTPQHRRRNLVSSPSLSPVEPSRNQQPSRSPTPQNRRRNLVSSPSLSPVEPSRNQQPSRSPTPQNRRRNLVSSPSLSPVEPSRNQQPSRSPTPQNRRRNLVSSPSLSPVEPSRNQQPFRSPTPQHRRRNHVSSPSPSHVDRRRVTAIPASSTSVNRHRTPSSIRDTLRRPSSTSRHHPYSTRTRGGLAHTRSSERGRPRGGGGSWGPGRSRRRGRARARH